MRPKYAFTQDVLSEEECILLCEHGRKHATPALLGPKSGFKNYLIRTGKTHFFRAGESGDARIEETLQRVANKLQTVAQDEFGVILGDIEPIQYTSYKCPYGHYKWHYDISGEAGGGGGSHRIISASLELSDPSSYYGGGLELAQIKNTHGIAPRGSMVTFPSIILHRAKPVYWGHREALVLWGIFGGLT